MTGIHYQPEAAGGLQLGETLDCGQAFRWQPLDNQGLAWEGIAGRHYIKIRQESDCLRFFCTEEEFRQIWRPYFDLDADYGAMKENLRKLDPILETAIAYAPGIRLLRQDPFEAMCAFILSSNCNIPRIKGMIQRLCQICGEPIGRNFDGTELFAFPTADTLARQTPESLAPVRAGFRTGYLLNAARMVSSGQVNLAEIHSGSLNFSRAALQTIRGVGPKVAECILLYGFHRLEAFPMDVWMKRAMDTLFPGKTPEFFGADAGLAQQYLFHYSRMHPELFQPAAG